MIDEYPEPHMDENVPIVGTLKIAGKIVNTNEQSMNQLCLIAEMAQQITELKQILRKCEWADKNYCDHSDCCPICGNEPENGHESDCELDRLLNK